MEIKLKEKYDFYGIPGDENSSSYETVSLPVKLNDNSTIICRIKKGESLVNGEIYHFTGTGDIFKNRLFIFINSYTKIDDMDLPMNDKKAIFDSFSNEVIIDTVSYLNEIKETVDHLENPIIKAITQDIFSRFESLFEVYPAATRFHHAYRFGLLYHTGNMLRMGKAIVHIYGHMNEDLVYAGIILHDILKTKEINQTSGDYTIPGKLLGHITMGTGEIMKTASRLGFEGSDEAILLEHIILSHHEEPIYGSPKHPQIIEALVVHLTDMCDAKIEPTIEALRKVDMLEFTDPIFVNDKERYLKHKLSK